MNGQFLSVRSKEIEEEIKEDGEHKDIQSKFDGAEYGIELDVQLIPSGLVLVVSGA